MAIKGSIVVGAVAGAILLVLTGWIPVIGALISGIVAGGVTKGLFRGLIAGFLAGVVGFVIVTYLLSDISLMLDGIIGAASGSGTAEAIAMLEFLTVPFASLGGLIGGVVGSMKQKGQK
jgi:hypothetical protein